jgi:hypothetical protein
MKPLLDLGVNHTGANQLPSRDDPVRFAGNLRQPPFHSSI